MLSVARRILLRTVVLLVVGATWMIFSAGPVSAQESPEISEAVPGESPAVSPGVERAERAADDTAQPTVVVAEPSEPSAVNVTVTSDDSGLSRSVLIVLLLTVGSVAPGIMLMMTSFTRFAIVLSLTRNAVGAQQIPPNQVLMGLALFLTFFVMAPVLSQINEDAIQPLLAGELEQGEALGLAYAPLQTYMLAQTDEDDLRLFYKLAEEPPPANPSDVKASTLVPAFMLSELRTAFTIGFVIFIPFLVIDLVVASVLMSMGMVMLPPVFISLPIKLLLFVLVDGWALVIGSMVASVQLT
jgi:flagellar biosynthesis protein FliP